MPRGRPKLDIDPEKVRQYAMLGLKRTEIAGLLDCNESVIRKRFNKQYLSGKGQRIAAIRKAQWDSMQKGDVPMLIWLGKNELEQTDKQNQSHEGKVTVEVVYKKQGAKDND